MTALAPLVVALGLAATLLFFAVFLGAMTGEALGRRPAVAPRLDGIGEALVGSARRAFLLGLGVLVCASAVETVF